MDAVASEGSVRTGPWDGATASVWKELFEALRVAGVESDAMQIVQGLAESDELTVIALLGRCRGEGAIDEVQHLTALARILGTKFHYELDAEGISKDFVARVPIRYARKHRLLGLAPQSGYMPLVGDGAADLGVAELLGSFLRTPVMVEFAPAAVFDRLVNEAYARKHSDIDGVLDELGTQSEPDAAISFGEDGDLLDSASRAPVIRLVNMLLFDAVKQLASDVHIQPLESRVQCRFRIDGVLYDHAGIPFHLLDEVMSRIKVIGGMDIAEKRLAQDGRTTVAVGDRSIDLRISVIPTSFGERAVLRLLDKSARLYELAELGMSLPDRARFERLIQKTHGIILVTGPTGSGKSTTLYAALRYLDCKERNILTLEDPIEYQLPGISQMQVSSKKGMTFATGLRAVLRQDPDIIMVGEIRDEETARMAVQSSLTGHLVFSTLHTNNAAGAVSRLLDLGIEPYLVASSLLACIAQRLVRVVCPRCSREAKLNGEAIADLGASASMMGQRTRQPVGCEGCAQTGYRGRVGIFESLVVSESIRELIVAKTKTSAIEACAIREGMTTLRQDAVRLLVDGKTTMEEVMRVTHDDASIERAPIENAHACGGADVSGEGKLPSDPGVR